LLEGKKSDKNSPEFNHRLPAFQRAVAGFFTSVVESFEIVFL